MDSEGVRVGCREERGRDGRERPPTSSLRSMDPYKEQIDILLTSEMLYLGEKLEASGSGRLVSQGERSSGTEGAFRSQGRAGASECSSCQAGSVPA